MKSTASKKDIIRILMWNFNKLFYDNFINIHKNGYFIWRKEKMTKENDVMNDN